MRQSWTLQLTRRGHRRVSGARLAVRTWSPETGEVSAISANGSSSVFYDVVEAAAIQELCTDRTTPPPVHSIKSMLGQTGAVTPVLQAIAAALAAPDSTCRRDRPLFS